MRVILGSLSPRRRELIGKVIDVTDVIASDVEEKCTEREPELAVKQIAGLKMSFFDKPEYSDALIITADTIVYHDGKILGKPHSKEAAFDMLRELSGEIHTVYTGVCVKRGNRSCCFVEESKVRFKQLSDKTIEDYIATGSPFDKAGGYGIQDSGFVAEIIGSFDNVMGLPTERLREELSDFLEHNEINALKR